MSVATGSDSKDGATYNNADAVDGQPPSESERTDPANPQITEEDEVPRGGLAIAIAAVAGPLALGLFGLVLSIGLGIGEVNSPGPGMWPLIISAFLMVLSAAGIFGVKRDTDVETWGTGFVRISLGLVSLIAYALLFERIGFEIPTLLLLFLWTKVLGREGWRTAIAVSVVATVSTYALFILALRVNIPHLF